MGEPDPIAELYAEVYANPGDDQVRRVLSDALLALGDPRGELIMFQLERDKDYHRRAMRLVQQHGLTWLGPLRELVLPLAYERGFLASCQLVSGATDRIDYGIPMWATVHTIDLEQLESDDLFEVTPAMRSLRTLTGLAMTRAADLTRGTPALAARLRLVMRGDPQPMAPTERYDEIDE
ncbi:MAG: hypothetical protein H0V17_28880 [Deltaproteobacteria bacterium]|nr:hypothetical protein [Deltaproteobacteria bacterium]